MRRPRKILIISHSLIVENYRRLFHIIGNDNRFEITILTPLFWKESGKWSFFKSSKMDKKIKIVKDIPIFLWLKKPLLNLTLIYPTLFYLLIKNRYDTVHIIEEPYSITSFMTISILKIINRDTKILCFSAQNLYKDLPFPFSFFEKTVIRLSDTLLPITRDVSGVLRKKESKKKHFIVPLGLDDPQIDFAKRKMRNGPLRIAFIGRLEPFKGIDLFLRLAKKYKKGFEFIIAGNGSMIDQIKDNKNINYKGFIKNTDINNFLQNIDLLIVPSRTTEKVKEQFGRVVIEALFNNCPVLVSDSGELPNLVDDKRFIFKEGNKEELIIRFKELVKHIEDGSIKDMINPIRNKIIKRYSFKTISKKLKKIYSLY